MAHPQKKIHPDHFKQRSLGLLKSVAQREEEEEEEQQQQPQQHDE